MYSDLKMIDPQWWKKNRDAKIFLREKPVDILLCLMNVQENYPSKLAKDTKCTYSHTVHLLQKIEKMGLVEFEKRGRLKLVRLTKNGQKISEGFRDLKRAF